VLRRIFGPKRDEDAGSWKKLHNLEIHNSYSSPVIVSAIKSRTVQRTRNVAYMEKMRNI
jgi:hypothetical protein